MIVYRLKDRFARKKVATFPVHDVRLIDDLGRMAMATALNGDN